jgi:TPR repeat protein
MKKTTKDRRAEINKEIKEEYGGGLDYFKQYSTPQSYDSKKESYDIGISKGVLEKYIADFLLEHHEEIYEMTNNEIKNIAKENEYEIYRYPELKKLANKIESAISRINDNNDKKGKFVLKKSPEIITAKRGGFNATTGRYDETDPKTDYFILIDPMDMYFIKRIGCISSSLLLDPNINYLIKDIEKWKLQNPKFFTLLRDVFYHSALYGYEKLENISAIIDEEQRVHGTGNLPLELIITKQVSVIIEVMGLFVMGHEYAHLLLHYKPKKSNKDIEKTPDQEFQTDALALDLVFNCIQHDYAEDPEKYAALCNSCIGIEILFNLWNVMERMRSVLNLNPESNYPLAKERMEKIKSLMYNSCEKWELYYDTIMYLDIIDYIFDKLGDYFVKELSKKYNVAYNEKDSLSVDSNNIATLFELGMTSFNNYQYDESLKCFSKIIVKIKYDNMLKGITNDITYYIVIFHVGFIYIWKAEEIVKNNDKLDKKQQEKMDALYNDAIKYLEDASLHYDHNGMVYYNLGIAYIYKKEYLKAMRCVKVLENTNIDTNFTFALKKFVLSSLSEHFNISVENTNITDVTISAKKGDHKEALKLAVIYECGIDVPENMKKAIYWYVRVAKKGVVQAQVRLGFYFANKNIKKSTFWFQKAATLGDPTAQEMLEKMKFNK